MIVMDTSSLLAISCNFVSVLAAACTATSRQLRLLVILLPSLSGVLYSDAGKAGYLRPTCSAWRHDEGCWLVCVVGVFRMLQRLSSASVMPLAFDRAACQNCNVKPLLSSSRTQYTCRTPQCIMVGIAVVITPRASSFISSIMTSPSLVYIQPIHHSGHVVRPKGTRIV